MKTLKNYIVPFSLLVTIAALLVFVNAPDVSAQSNSFTTTTLSAAAGTPATNINQSQIRLTSITGVTFPSTGSSTNGSMLWVDDSEAMQVISVSPPGTTSNVSLTVFRGWNGTPIGSHASGAKVYIGQPTWYHATAPPFGTCTASQQTVLPWINVNSGLKYNCGNGVWTSFVQDGHQAIGATTGATLASATTIVPTNPIMYVSGTTDVVTITVPPACPNASCVIQLIPTGVWHTTNAGNIAVASTAVVSNALYMTYNPTTAKWYPSY